MPENKLTQLTKESSASGLVDGQERDYYNKLVLQHRSVVEDYSRIEARIRELESQLEGLFLPGQV
ncbi:MAG: hypothetical protein LBP22_10155 [Deltaproteobacteria bacterium]|nr:hypothetical protein [Deltaproteobacteria bacterium]